MNKSEFFARGAEFMSRFWPGVKEPKRNEALFICLLEGICATIHAVFITGKFFIGYLLMLGANPLFLGLVNSLPFFFQGFQFLSGYLMNAVRSRIKAAFWGSVPGRLLWLVAIILPFLPITFFWKIVIFIIMYALYNILMVVSGNAWLLWMNEVVPLSVRGRYIATRSAVFLVIATVADLLGSRLLDYFRAINQEPAGFALLFIIASIFAAIGGWLLLKQWEPPFQKELVIKPTTILRHLKKERNYLNLIYFFGFWNFAIGLPSAFWSTHMLTNLKMTYSHIWTYSLIVTIAGFVASFFWGRLMDRTGNKPILMLTGSVIITFPLIWLFPTAQNWSILYFEAALNGIFWVGFNTAGFNLPLILAPLAGRPQYIAMFATVSGMAFGTASLAGGLIAQFLSDLQIPLLGQTFVNYHFLFIMSSCLRVVALFSLQNIQEPTGRTVNHLVQEIGAGVQKAKYVGRQVLFLPYQWLRRK